MQYTQLPEAEFTVMQEIWKQDTPVSGSEMTDILYPTKGWKHQTVYTLLNRLVKKGFLTSEKQGKERYYQSLVCQEDYLRQETERFVEQFHKNSIVGLMSTFVSNKSIDDAELSELSAWMDER